MAADTGSPSALPPQNTAKPKRTRSKSVFMAHDPDTFACNGKYTSVDWRYGALKCCSRMGGEPGVVHNILLRKTGTKEVRQYEGNIVSLDTPQIVKRGDRVISYTKKPVVKFVKKFMWGGGEDCGEDPAAAPEPDLPVPPEEANKPVKRAKSKRTESNDDVDPPPLPTPPVESK
jgi:hypothetical protein